MKKLSVALAVRNEQENIERCLNAVMGIADEIIVFDEYSSDKTAEIARKMGAQVFLEPHHANFHITKQKAIEKCRGEWILQLDADEVVTKDLAQEILSVINLSNTEIKNRKISTTNAKLFARHLKALEERDGRIGVKTGEVVAFFVPRLNMFLGKPLRYAGVYPDPAIRLIKNGKAYLPAKSVHEIMEIKGEVAWLENYMLHYDSPTLKRYLDRANRYTSFSATKFKEQGIKKNVANLIYYSFIKPLSIFIKLFIRHKGFLDGYRGFLWSFFSALHFPLAYFKYYTNKGGE